MNVVQVIALRFGIGVFDPRWLDHRLALFRATMAPALLAQAGVPFHVGVQIDRRLPQEYKDSLADLMRDIPGATLRPIDLHSDRGADHQSHLAEVCETENATHFLSTRCDDDDAVTPGAFKVVQERAVELLERGVPRAVIAIRHGLRCAIAQRLGFWENHKANGIGLSVLQPEESNTTIYSASHVRLPELAADRGWEMSYIEKDAARWLYVNHKLSDSDFEARLSKLQRKALPIDEYDKALRLFPLDHEALNEWMSLDLPLKPRASGKITEQVKDAESKIIAARRRNAPKEELDKLFSERMQFGAKIVDR